MMEKTHVLHFIPGFLFGGIESMYLSWYSRVDKERFEFELLLRTQDDEAESLRQYREMGGIYHRLTKMSPISMWRYARSVRVFFREHHDYQILHAHGTDPFVFHYAKKYAIRHIILHAHTTDHSKGEKFLLIKKTLHQAAMPYVSDRFACSRLAGKWLFGEKLMAENRVKIIYNAIDVEKYAFNQAVRDSVRHSFNLEEKFVVGHVGRMTYQKNYPFLLEVFAEIARIKDNAILMLIGDGPDRPSIEKRIKELGIRNKVLLLGIRKDVHELMQAMDVFLLPSHYEGLPVVAVEAQAAGLPCIISDKVTDEVCLTNLVKRLSLDDVKIWSSEAIQINTDFVETRNTEARKLTDFEISSQINELEKNYERILSNESQPL